LLSEAERRRDVAELEKWREQNEMGTDYYLADPESKQLIYIDRCGSDFACAGPIEHRRVEGWPPGQARVLTREIFDEVGELAPEERHSGTFRALSWCAGRRTVLLIDDAGGSDEENSDFCYEVNHGDGVPGWVGKDLL
jgi:hypothetical protein